MATPRIFVSSTCYDLQEIRFQLRGFIQEYGYEAVLSEFDDIFFDYDKHVQDACIDEIPKCQLFILIIGNNYGSFYHKDNSNSKIPDSVTLREFKKALNHKISKHLFINKFVDYDYKNHKRAFSHYITNYFQENEVADEDVEKVRVSLKENFNASYHFPNDSYKLIFPFLDIVYELNEGNAVSTFESFSDIKESLKKQWAGLIYEALTAKKHATSNQVNNLEAKIDNIEKSINKLIGSKTSEDDGSITLNVDNLIKETQIHELEKVQDKIQSILWNLCNVYRYDYNNDGWPEKRFWFLKPITLDTTKKWLAGLKTITHNYKWSKYINIRNLFKDIPITNYQEEDTDIEYKQILELYNIYKSLVEEEKDNFSRSVQQLLQENCKVNDNIFDAPSVIDISADDGKDDDLPF